MAITLRPLAAAFALATLCDLAAAQITPIVVRTLVSPPQLNANRHHCTVTNVSSQPVALTRLQLVTVDAAVVASASCAGPGAQLGPGQSCTLVSPEITALGVGLPFGCRAQHQGPEKAVVGAIQSFYSLNGDTRAIGMLPMSLATGISLAP